jgi:KAP family P-loop domain
MVFVVAADEELVRGAIATQLPNTNRAEAIAANYLEKIIQIPVHLPRLPFHDAEAYIGLLLCSHATDEAGLGGLLAHGEERRAAGAVPLVANLSNDAPFVPEPGTLRLAAQIAKGLGGDRVGNPRQIKRFPKALESDEHRWGA